MESCLAVKIPLVPSKVFTAISVLLFLCYLDVSLAMPSNVYCFTSSEGMGGQDDDLKSVEDCCLRHPGGSYQLAGPPATFSNCRSVPLFSCSTSLCPGNSTRCFCRVNNMATSVTWSFSSPRTLCKNNTIVAWNASQTACGNHISARVEDCTQGVTSCQQSVLTIVGDASIDGVMVTCIETATPYVVGQSVITVPRVPDAPSITGVDLNGTHLIVQWNTSTTGGLPTDQLITIQGFNSSLSFPLDSDSRMHAVKVAGNVLYDITITVANCAGMKQTTHRLFNISESIVATTRVDINYNCAQLEIAWNNALQTTSSYELTVAAAEGNSTASHGLEVCSAALCTSVLQLAALRTNNHKVTISSFSKQGVLTAKGFSLVEYSTDLGISKVQIIRNSSSAVEIGCSFQRHQIQHCLVCCDTSSSLLNYSIFNVSTSRDGMASVTLQGLQPDVWYYCSAEAVNMATANCTSPAVGSLKVLLKIKTQDRFPTDYLPTLAVTTLSSPDNEMVPTSSFIAVLSVLFVLLF